MATLEQQLKPLFKAGNELRTGTFVKGVHRIAARPLKEEGLKQVAAAIGSDRQIRNWPRRGKPVKGYVRYDIKGETLELAFVPAGLFSVVEFPTRHAPIGTPIARTRKAVPRIWQKALFKRWNRVVR